MPHPAKQSDLREMIVLIQRRLHHIQGSLAHLTNRAAEAELREILASSPYSDPRRLEHSGFRVFSKHGQDGIIQEIFRRIGAKTRTFIEFGAEKGIECNTRLLLWLGWNGLWIEADAQSIVSMQKAFAQPLSRGLLRLRQQFVTAENIDGVLTEEGFSGEIDLLVIDVDGNDVHIWENIACINPRVVLIEYNASLPPPIDFVVPYAPDFRWDGSMYYGASLVALKRVFGKTGYSLVGTEICGSDALFVRDDLVESNFCSVGDVVGLYNPPRYRLNVGFPTGHRAPLLDLSGSDGTRRP